MDAEVKIETVQLKEEIIHLGEDFVVDETLIEPENTETDTMSPNTGELMKNDVETDAYVEIGCGLNSVADEGQQHVCMNCGGSYASQCALYHHLTRECEEPSQSREETCPFCSFTTESMDDLHSHVTMKHRILLDPQAMEFQTNERMDLQQFRCLICSREMLHREDLDQHIFWEHNKIFKVCLVRCATGGEISSKRNTILRSFKTQQTLQHRGRYCDKTKTYSRKFKCSSCPYKTKLKKYLSRHVKAKHPVETVWHYCESCGRSYKYKERLRKHAKSCVKKVEEIVELEYSHRSHGTINYQVCERCQKTYATTKRLHRHMKYCERLKTLKVQSKCFHCSYETKRKDHLRRHIERQHLTQPSERPVCPGCWKSLGSIPFLRVHMKYCEGTNAAPVKFKCFHCLFETKWKGCLRSHIQRRHLAGVRPVCHLCEKSYDDQNDLKTHLKYCGKKRDKLNCSHCLYVSSWKAFEAGLWRKDPISKSVRTDCKLCGKHFEHVNSLILHIRNSCKGKTCKEWKCGHCYYETENKNLLRQHIERMHPSKRRVRAVCKLCGTHFAHLSNLKKHLKDSCKGKRFEKWKCGHCLYETKMKWILRQHIARKHSNRPRVRPFCLRCEEIL